ncbi:MAG: hypothetical protein ACI4HO_08660 [Ruminococcus sp.]
MTNIEIIDRLCSIVNDQAELIRQLALRAAEAGAITKELTQRRESLQREIRSIERTAGPIITSAEKEAEE